MDNQRKRGSRHRRVAGEQKSAQRGTAYLNNTLYGVPDVVYCYIMK